MTSPDIPASIGRYQILRLLGRGGMGEVYLCSDPALGRQVAIKMLPGHLQADPKMRARFMNEARAIASLNHPNVVTIHDVGITDERDVGFPTSVLYLVIEFVEGLALDEEMEKRRLSVLEAIDFAVQILEGLKVAHQNRILHRDITPANLMITPENRVKILDFGLSKLLLEGAPDSSRPRQTGEGMIVGTLDYLSPEQALGHPLDERSDLFSVGIVLYQMLAGSHPFSGPTVTQMVARMMTQPAHPYPDGLDVPESVRQIVEKALRKEPKDRYGSALEMILDLRVARRELMAKYKRSVDDSTGSLSRPALPPARAPLPAPPPRPTTVPTAEAAPPRRRRWVVFAVGFVLLLGLVLLAIALRR